MEGLHRRIIWEEISDLASARLFNVNSLELTLHWHYTPNGCSVSPHCDAKHKLGSHIFYLNTEKDWKEHWGGETVVLDDEGQFDRQVST